MIFFFLNIFIKNTFIKKILNKNIIKQNEREWKQFATSVGVTDQLTKAIKKRNK